MNKEESDSEREEENVTNSRSSRGKRVPAAKGKMAANGANKRADASNKTAVKYPKKKGKRGRKEDEEEEKEKEGEEEKEEVYEVESIVESKLHRGKRLFKIRWKGFGPENDSWEPEAKLSCEELINGYFKENPDKDKGKKPSAVKNDGRKKMKGDSPGSAVKEDDGEGAQDYEVEKIMEVHFKKNNKREFLIHWKGFQQSENTWEPEENLNCPELIEKFMAKVDKAKSATTPELRANPKHTKHFTLNQAQAGRKLSRRNEGKQRATYHSCM